MAHIDQAKRIHLIGIGGCSMNVLALILQSQGHVVTGSDREQTQFTPSLDEAGIPYSIGQNGQYVRDADLVIYSAAIKPDNPERVLAKELGIPELERSVALGQISERFPQVVAIAGCHGKTTITSMLACVNEMAHKDATVHVGGFVELLQGGVKVGGSDTFITEACEYVESFLTLRPTIALINNIDDDHLDYFKNFDNIVEAFRKFLDRLPEDGLFVADTDDETVRGLVAESTRRVKTYGLKNGTYRLADIEFDEEGCSSFTITKDGKPVGRAKIHVPGLYSARNALATYVVAEELGVSFEDYAKAMDAFRHTKRRFEYYGEREGVRYYHDYGHHPNEIAATLDAASRMPHSHLYCVLQCNSYTRAKTLFCKKTDCFVLADTVLVSDIYPGREKDDGTVHARDIADAINSSGTKAVYLGSFENIREWLDKNAGKNDIVIAVGSGDVYRQAKKLL